MTSETEKVIRQIQIHSRAAANLPGYNPENPIQDPTQQQPLSCYLCSNGKQQLKKIMPRGCFICGRLNDDVSVPNPISFNSTLAFNCLLTSLTLHGSEIIVDKRQGEIALSEFLNFRVEAGQLVEQNSKFASLSTDSFFFKSNEEEEDVSTTIIEDSAHDIASLSKVLAEERPQGFSEWEADFQFADAGDESHVSSSSDHFTGISAQDSELFDRSNDVSARLDSVQESESFGPSNDISVHMDSAHDSESFDRSIDLSVHMDSVFGDAKNVVAQQPNDDLAMLNDWNLDELGTTGTSGLGTIVTSEDDHSNSVDLFDDIQRITNNTRAVESLMAVEEQKTIKEDLFDDGWNGFAGSQEPSGNVESDFQIANTSVSENTAYLGEINDDSFDEWNDFTGSSISQNPSNFFQSGLQTNASPVTVTVNTTIFEEDRAAIDYTDDVWSVFPGSSSIQDPSAKFWNQSQTNDAHVTENTSAKEHGTINDDLFDDWNGFAGSSSLQKLSGDIQIESRPTDTSITENTAKLVKNEAINDAWNDFTDSNNLQAPSVNGEKELNTKKLEENVATDDEWDGFTGSNSILDPPTNIWNEWQTNDTRGTENSTVTKDSFDEFNDLTIPSNLQIPSENGENELQEKDTNVTENTTMPQDTKAKNGDPIGEWSGFSGSSILQDHSGKFQNELQLQTNGSHVTSDVVLSNENEMIEEDSLDEWNDFTGSSVQVSPENVHTELQKNDTGYTTMPEENNAKHDDATDQWNFLTASSSLHGPSVDSWNQWQTNDPRVMEHMTEGKEQKTISENNDSNVNDNTNMLEENKGKHDDSIDQWNFLTASSSLQGPSVDSWSQWQTNDPHVTEHMTEGKEQKTTSEKNDSNVTDNTTMSEENKAKHDDPINQWNFFTASSSLQGPSIDSWNQWQTNDSRVTEHMTEGKERKMISEKNDLNVTDNTTMLEENKAKHDDPIDQWNFLTASSSLPGPPVDSWNQWKTNDLRVTEHMTESKEHKTISEKNDSNITDNTTMQEENKAKHDDPIDQWSCFTAPSSLHDPSVDSWNQWQINGPRVTEHKTISDDEWNNFTGIGGLHEPPRNVEIELQMNNARNNENLMKPDENKTVKKEIFDEWNSVTNSNNLQDPNHTIGCATTSKEMRISGPLDKWNGFTGSSSLPDPSANVGNKSNKFPISSKAAVENDMFSSNSVSDNIAESFWSQWQVDKTPVQDIVTTAMEDKTENDDSLDEWNDFTGAGSLQDSSTNVGSELQTNDTLVTDTGMTGTEQMVDDDSYDEWNDFTGSSNFQSSSGSVRNGKNQVADTKSAEIDIFSFSLENLNFTSLSNISSPTK